MTLIPSVSITVSDTFRGADTGALYPHRQSDGTFIFATTAAEATGRLRRDGASAGIDDTASTSDVLQDAVFPNTLTLLRDEAAVLAGVPAAPTNLTVKVV